MLSCSRSVATLNQRAPLATVSKIAGVDDGKGAAGATRC